MIFDDSSIKSELETKFKIIYPNSENYNFTNFTKFNPKIGGWESQIYFIDLDFIKDNNKKLLPSKLKLVIRVLMGNNTTERAKEEFKTMQFLKESNINVPKVYFWEKSGTIFENTYYIMERIEGRLLDDILFDQNIDYNKRQEYFYQFVKSHVLIHNINWRAKNVNSEYEINEYSFIETKLRKFEIYIQKMGYIEIKQIVDWLKININLGKSRNLSFLHKDYHPQNIIVSNDGELYIIDWSSSEIGDYRYDIGWTLMLMITFLGDSEARDQYIQIYENIAGKIINIEFWEVMACLRRLVDIFDFFNPSINSNIREGVKDSLLGEVSYSITNLLERIKLLTKLDISKIEIKIKNLKN